MEKPTQLISHVLHDVTQPDEGVARIYSGSWDIGECKDKTLYNPDYDGCLTEEKKCSL